MTELLHFEWVRATDGWEIVEIDPQLDQIDYELEEYGEGARLWRAERITPRKGTPLATRRLIEKYELALRLHMLVDEDSPPPTRWKIFLIPKSDSLTHYKPFELNRAIFMEFAEIPDTPEGAKKFFDRYGPITRPRWNINRPAKEAHPDDLGPVDIGGEIFAPDFDLRPDLLMAGAAYGQDQWALHHLRSAISEWRSAEQTGDYQRVLDRFTRSEINKRLELILQKVRGIKLPILALQPRDLADAMGIQLAQAISGAFNIQKCPSCPSWFVYGTGTGRRASRTYCSTRCKQAAYRKRRDKKQ